MNVKSKSTLERFNNYMKVKNYADNTVKVYLYYCKEFLSVFDLDAYHINNKDVERYLMEYDYKSVSQQNQVINSVKLFCKSILKKKLQNVSVERPRKEKKLPRVIDNVYLLDCINKIENLKHKTIISLAYSVGLRVSEVINLQIKDLDSKRKIITIRQSKGNKDRIVPLTDTMLYLIADYWRKFKPTDYLFNGLNSLRYSATSCNKIVKKYLGENYHFHLLRHSCFTNLTDQGVDLRVIQKLAGHSSSKTTEIYTHVSNRVLHNLPLGI